jgi:hypothetical protein
MNRWIPIAAILALAGCTAQTATDAVGCATAVQAAIATPPGMTDAQKGIAAGIAAAGTPACIGLSADAIAAMGQLKTATPSVAAVHAPK